MNARSGTVDVLEPCPTSFAYFLALLSITHGPENKKAAPHVRECMDKILARASDAGFKYVGALKDLIASGESDTARVRRLATRLGEAVGDEAMVEMLSALKTERGAA